MTDLSNHPFDFESFCALQLDYEIGKDGQLACSYSLSACSPRRLRAAPRTAFFMLPSLVFPILILQSDDI